MKRSEKQAILRGHVNKLMELFDHVQIHVSWRAEDGGTCYEHRGAGDHFARHGLARDYLDTDLARINASEIADHIQPDDPDDWKA